MLKKELVEKISKYFKLTEFEAEKIYYDIFEVIIHGVKDDNIVDVANFGEFIIKYSNGKSSDESKIQGYKKTVEFLAKPDLEEDINIRFSERVIFSQEQTQTSSEKEISEPVIEEKHIITPSVEEITQTTFTETDPSKKIQEIPPVSLPTREITSTLKDEFAHQVSLEEELKKKREEILNKLTTTSESETSDATDKYQPLLKEKVESIVREKLGYKTEVPPKTITEETKITETKSEEEQLITEKVTEEQTEVKKTSEEEDISSKSFADYFTAIQTAPPVPEKESFPEEDTTVIPQSAIDLHKQITGEFPVPPVTQKEFAPEQQVQQAPINDFEHRDSDNSYYIWYKEAESTPADTQTLSYEYELLYQATKEAEYKSKLKIYVTTFILFFSIVLALLIFSPLIYKTFFKPIELPVIESTETKQPEEQNSGVNQQEQQQSIQQVTPVEQKQPTQQQVQQGSLGSEQQTQTQQQQSQQTQQQETQQTQQQQTQQPQPQTTEPNITGLTKNSMGWTDEKYKVIYIRLDNGKYTIQESAWDSDQKASKRVSSVESYKIQGLKGSVLKVDLGDKGIWYRTRFGEFSTIEEARQKAEELRNKERLKLQAFLFTIFLFA